MRRPDPGRAILAIVVMAAAGFAVYDQCVIPYRDSLVMRDVEKRMAIVEDVDSYRAMSLARLNLADLDRVARSRRLDPSWYIFYGLNCEILDRWPDAVSAYTRALDIDQRPEIYFNRGLARLHLRQIDEATADLVWAVRFNPFLIDRISGELRARVAGEAGLQ